jgi:hypothetical protein
VRDGKDPSKRQKPTKKEKEKGMTEGKPYPDIGELVDSDGVLIIYDTNIVDGKLVIGNLQEKGEKGQGKNQYVKGFNNKEREEYISSDGTVKSHLVKKTPITGPTILVTRGHGNAYRFNYVLVKDKEFYAENHVNMIVAKTAEAKQRVEAVYKALGDPRTARFVEQFVGNGAISATELETVIPIFLS